MRPLRFLPLLMALLAPTALAERLYEVELIIFRQGSQVLPASQPAAEDWASGANRLGMESQRSTSLDGEVAKLKSSANYQVLLHQAWQQTLRASSERVAFTSGEGSFDQYPVQGVIGLSLAETLELEADIWVNQLDEQGLLLQSERLRQSRRLTPGELTYLDHGSIGALIRARPL